MKKEVGEKKILKGLFGGYQVGNKYLCLSVKRKAGERQRDHRRFSSTNGSREIRTGSGVVGRQ